MCIETDEVFEILRARPRRVVLTLLKRDGGRVSKADIASRSDSPAEQAAIELTHVHLPKLEDAGYITWFRDAEECSRGPRFDEIEPFVTLLTRHTEALPNEWP